MKGLRKGATSQCRAPWQDVGMPLRTGDGEALRTEELNQNLFGGGGVSGEGKEEIDQIRARRGPAVWWGNRPVAGTRAGTCCFLVGSLALNCGVCCAAVVLQT